MKRTILVIIALVTTLILGAPRLCAEQEGDFGYSIENNSVTVTGYTGKSDSVTIPDKIAGLPVRIIGKYAFNAGGNKSLENLTNVTIPPGVTMIGDRAFQWCRKLTRVNIPKGVTSIGSNAFNNTGLTAVTIPSSVTEIWDHAFSACNLASVTIPSGVTKIGDSAFAICANLAVISVDPANATYRSIDGVLFNAAQTELLQYPAGKKARSYILPGSITKIAPWAFAGSASLAELTIPNSVTLVGEKAFHGCKNLRAVTIPSSVANIGKFTFANCAALTKVVLSSGVLSIGDSSFSGCVGLTNVTIPDSVTTIEARAFEGCKNLTKILIPKGVTSLAAAFPGCTALSEIEVATGNPSYRSVDGILFNTNQTELIQYPAGKKNNSYTIPGGVRKLRYMSFRDCTSLSAVTIPSTVTEIQSYVFKGCTGLTSVTLPERVGMIEDEAFGNCTSLTSATFQGNAPGYFRPDTFKGTAAGFTIRYNKGKAGFTTPEWNGYKTVEIAQTTNPK